MIIVDPYSYHFDNDRLISQVSGDDGRNTPIAAALKGWIERGQVVHTSHYILNGEGADYKGPIDFFSVGMLNFRQLKNRPNIRFRSFVVHEPPVIAPRLYKILPELTATFDKVYLHNIDGEGYSLDGVDRKKLHKLYHPIGHRDVIEPFWSRREREKKLVVINSLQNPWVFRIVDITSFQSPKKFKFNSPLEMFSKSFTGPEHYSMRLEAIVDLARENAIDLYGRKWTKRFSPEVFWPAFLMRRRRLMKVYKGDCPSKLEVLGRYDFSLVIENSSMRGCVSEKIFDCLATGTIPVYFGPSDAGQYVSPETFVNIRKFKTWPELWEFLKSMNEDDKVRYREAGREYLRSEKSEPFRSIYEHVFS